MKLNLDLCTYVTVHDRLSSFTVQYLTSLDFARAPPLQINHDGHPSTSRDDPDDVLVAFVHFLVFGPCGDEGEIAGREGLFLIRCETGTCSKVGMNSGGCVP